MPGKIIDLAIHRMEPDDFLLVFTLESGERIQFCGRDYFEDGPAAGVVDLWSMLITQNTPGPLIERELARVDPAWEALVHARLEANRSKDRERQQAADAEVRSRRRREFLEGRSEGTS